MKRQGTLFNEEVLPLFSGVAPKGKVDVFTPPPATQQDAMFCPICKGACEVVINGRRVRCTCPECQEQK